MAQSSNSFLFIEKSGNEKTGRMPIVYSGRGTCPQSCPLRGKGGCYAENFRVSKVWDRVDARGKGTTNFAGLLAKVRALPEGTVWRYGAAGDIPGVGDSIDGAKLRKLTAAAARTSGYAYTHKPVVAQVNLPRAVATAAYNRVSIQAANNMVRGTGCGITLNLSADNLHEADQLAALGIAPVTVVLPKGAPNVQQTPGGRVVVKCPAQQSDGKVKCADCPLCRQVDRKAIIGFEAHGSRAKAADSVAKAVL